MIERLLWFDSLAGLSVGVAVLALASWLSELYGLPGSVVLFVGCANLVYGSYSGSLAIRERRGQTEAGVADHFQQAESSWAGLPGSRRVDGKM